MVDDALLLVAAPGTEVSDRQVLDQHVVGGVVEGRVVLVLAVQDRPGRPDVGVVAGRVDVGVRATAQRVHARGKPVRRVGLGEVDGGVVASRYLDRPRGRGRRAIENGLVPAHLGGRGYRCLRNGGGR